MTVSKKDLLESVRQHARAHYNTEGWDYVIETLEDDAELLELIGDATTAEQAITNVRAYTVLWADRRADIEATKW